LDDLLAAEKQRDDGITQNMKDKETRVWKWWSDYARSIGFSEDIWLSSLLPEQRTHIMGAFAAAYCRRQFSRPDERDLVASTVQEAMAKLGEIFRANVGYNPTYGNGSQSLHPLLTRQFRGMRNLDPGEVQQKALPVSVYWELHRVAAASSLLLDSTIAWLQTIAYFWCMRSCEYSNVQGEHRTKMLCVRNIRFFDSNNRDISSNLQSLASAATVSITFEYQKKEARKDTISHQYSGDKLGRGEMCPVMAAVSLIKALYSYNYPFEKVQDLPINYLFLDGREYTIPSSLILMRIHQAVSSLGESTLGFSADDVGTHSNHSGGAWECSLQALLFIQLCLWVDGLWMPL